MKIKQRFKRLLILLIVSALLFINVIPSFAADGNLRYYYDDLNRLISIVNNATGRVVEYQYDEVGNRTNKGTFDAYIITATAGNNGSISPGTVAVPGGYSQTFTITPNSGYLVADVLVNGASVGAKTSYTFSNVSANNFISASFVSYVELCTGGTAIFVGDDIVRTFTSSGTFTLSCSSAVTVQYLVVAGGGAGGTWAGGGGGAGGVRTGTTTLSAGNTTVTVGNGGATTTGNTVGANGENSVLGSIIAHGGGGGGSYQYDASSGGSGGGAVCCGKNYGAGNVSAGEGHDGGASPTSSSNPGGGGGGGASVKGTDASAGVGGAGGDGVLSSITGTPTYYGGGGGGSGYTKGNGGSGGGGGGGYYAPYSYYGDAGGSGIVLVRYSPSFVPSTGSGAASIGGMSYASLQAAYNAASDGATIKVKAVNLTEALNVNRNISVNIEGGYSADYTSITGNTTLKGMIRTYSGGGTLTIKNFILQN